MTNGALVRLSTEWKALSILLGALVLVAVGSWKAAISLNEGISLPYANARSLSAVAGDVDTLRSRVDLMAMRITIVELQQTRVDSLLRQILSNQKELSDTLRVTRQTQLQVLRVVCLDSRTSQLRECTAVYR